MTFRIASTALCLGLLTALPAAADTISCDADLFCVAGRCEDAPFSASAPEITVRGRAIGVVTDRGDARVVSMAKKGDGTIEIDLDEGAPMHLSLFGDGTFRYSGPNGYLMEGACR